MYQVSAPLTDEVGDLFIGATGAARVRAGSETIAQRIYLAAARTIRFEL